MKKSKALRAYIIIIVILALAIAALVGFLLFKDHVQSGTETNQIIVNETITNELAVNAIDPDAAPETTAQAIVGRFAKEPATRNKEKPDYYNPVVPAGFRPIGHEQDPSISEEADWTSENGYLYGLVIEDKNGNQFVWIPVRNISAFIRTTWENNDVGKVVSKTRYKEPKEDDEKYDLMKSKVKKYGGFYVGRYETGDATATAERTEVASIDKTVIKQWQIPYSFVPYKESKLDGRSIAGALELSEKFAEDNEYEEGIYTTLMYGVQWDAILRFVKSEAQSVTESESWGNFFTSEFTYINDVGQQKLKAANTYQLIFTGASEYTKNHNIYDLAGNLYEWTQEAMSDKRIVRGGNYVSESVGHSAQFRFAFDETETINSIGFRITMFIE